MTTKVKCSACKGVGQTNACRTEVHFVKCKREDGTPGKRMVTDKQGSGCMMCLGVGYVEVAK